MELFLLIYLVFIVVMFLSTINDFDCIAITPKQIYEFHDLNMFGCVVLFIFLLVLNPLFYAAHFLYWIFHVGRKRKERIE